jgi:hypothetical protein
MAIKILTSIVLLVASGMASASGMTQAALSEILLEDVIGNRVHLKVTDSKLECIEISFSGVEVEFDCEWVREIGDPDLQNIRILTQTVEESWFHTLEIPFFGFGEYEADEFVFVAEFFNGKPDRIFIRLRGIYPYRPIKCMAGECDLSID